MTNLTKQLPLDVPQIKTFMRIVRISAKFRTVPRWCYWESHFLWFRQRQGQMDDLKKKQKPIQHKTKKQNKTRCLWQGLLLEKHHVRTNRHVSSRLECSVGETKQMGQLSVRGGSGCRAQQAPTSIRWLQTACNRGSEVSGLQYFIMFYRHGLFELLQTASGESVMSCKRPATED